MKPLPQRHNEQLAITPEEINSLPLKCFGGDICMVTEPFNVIRIFEEISTHEVVGFDTETRPSFYKGQHYQVSLMQIALPEKVFLIRLNQTGFTKEIIFPTKIR